MVTNEKDFNSQCLFPLGSDFASGSLTPTQVAKLNLYQEGASSYILIFDTLKPLGNGSQSLADFLSLTYILAKKSLKIGVPTWLNVGG